MIIEGLSKEARKLFKSKLKAVPGLMFKTHSIKGYKEPKNIEVIYICLNLEEKLVAVNAVKEVMKSFQMECFEQAI